MLQNSIVSRHLSKIVLRFFLTNVNKICKLIIKKWLWKGERQKIIWPNYYMKKTNFYSVQEWLPFEAIFENGIIKLKNSFYIKIIEIIPINYNLKSELEKEAILNSYKIFLKTCNFDFQILIQSNKENLDKHISNIKIQKKYETENIKKIADNYINYINQLNQNKKSSNKNFYIVIKNPIKNEKTIIEEENIIEELNEKYFKIKECLARCGNIVKDINDKEKTKEIIYSFINKRLFLI